MNNGKTVQIEQGTIQVYSVLDMAEGFMIDRKSRGLSPGTLDYYKKKITGFIRYLSRQGIDSIDQITPHILREFLVYLDDTGHNRGGVLAYYKAIRAFMKWYQVEFDSLNPMDKVKAPANHTQPLDPIPLQDINRLLSVCDTRDKTIILTLIDTGLRASELIALTKDNVNPITGIIQVVHGKGSKSRVVYVGRKTRQAIRKYLTIAPKSDYLFCTDLGDPLTYWGLRDMVVRKAKKAEIKPPSLHSFRRLFALTMLRNGVDIYSLQLLMGHADLQVLQRYLKLTNQDTMAAHIKGSPVDKLI